MRATSLKSWMGLMASVLAAGAWQPASAGLLGPSTYQRAGDSPFSGLLFSYFHLENFESGALAAPGVSASPGVVLAPGQFTDSVDEDDGSVDGSGVAGRSWYSGGVAGAFSFTFDATVLGALPTHAGLVWTDVGQSSGTVSGVGLVQFEAFDAMSASLGIVGPSMVGDGTATGGTAEDRFFGVTNAGGISRIVITALDSTDWEIDHLQFGRARSNPLPEPGSLALLTAALALGGYARLRVRA